MMFSIIVPVYNVAPYLRESLDSVLAQTCGDWECICVDDGSTDASGCILDEYSARDGRFIVLHQENKGVSSARNLALDVARGKWIVFLDADDCLHPSLLTACKDIGDIQCADMVMFGLGQFENEIEYVRWDSTDAFIDVSTYLQYDVVESGFSQFAYSRAMIHDLRFPSYTVGEDRLFLSYALIRAGRLSRVNGVGYYYRQRIGSAMNGKISLKKLKDSICHSVRRLMVLIFCTKKVEWHVYRHQIGLWINMIVPGMKK